MLKLDKSQYENSILQFNCTEYEKNIMIQNFLLEKDLQIPIATLFIRCIFFFVIWKYAIENRKFNFLTRICKIW